MHGRTLPMASLASQTCAPKMGTYFNRHKVGAYVVSCEPAEREAGPLPVVKRSSDTVPQINATDPLRLSTLMAMRIKSRLSCGS